jgi:rSAM/selenodomain-associated transferase 2
MANSISIIIPVRNESETLPGLLTYLFSLPGQEFLKEIIVSDGMSSDETVAIAAGFGASVILCSDFGRGFQMNEGAIRATGNILYFLHADSRPPANFLFEIILKVTAGFHAGCFRLRFDHDHWFLKANAWFTRFNVNAVRFGDQSLFIKKDSFMKIGGFREDLIIMEDQEIVSRIKAHGKFNVIPGYVLTSARKYRVNGIFRMQAIFFYIYFSYRLGMSQSKLVNQYRKLIRSA